MFSGRARARRRARAGRLGSPYLFPLALVAVVAFLIWRNWEALTSFDLPIAAAGAETQVKEALAHQDRAALADVYGFMAGGTAQLQPVRFGDVTVSVDQGKARVLAVVEARGRVVWRGEKADLSYVGRESFGMTRCKIALWCADGEQFARLRGVLTALFRRTDAAATRDVASAGRVVSDGYAGPGGKPALLARLGRDFQAPVPRVHVRAWQIRVERDRAAGGRGLRRGRGRAAPGSGGGPSTPWCWRTTGGDSWMGCERFSRSPSPFASPVPFPFSERIVPGPGRTGSVTVTVTGTVTALDQVAIRKC